MPDWKKLIAGKIAIAQKGNSAGKPNANIRVPAGQKQVNNFPVLDMGVWLACDITFLCDGNLACN